LAPWDFRRLTVREFRWMVRGHRRDQQDRWIQIATVAAWLLTPHTKQAIKPTQLLGWPANWMAEKDPDG